MNGKFRILFPKHSNELSAPVVHVAKISKKGSLESVACFTLDAKPDGSFSAMRTVIPFGEHAHRLLIPEQRKMHPEDFARAREIAQLAGSGIFEIWQRAKAWQTHFASAEHGISYGLGSLYDDDPPTKGLFSPISDGRLREHLTVPAAPRFVRNG